MYIDSDGIHECQDWGGDNGGYEEIIGKEGLGEEISDNGERFADFCASHTLVIDSILQQSITHYCLI